MYLVVLALVGSALASAWWRAMHEATPLPLHGVLRNQGFAPGEASDAAGLVALAYAARRCAFCASGTDCRRRVAAGTPPPAHCPNSAMFARFTRPSA
jgi:hypothetical protein